MEDLERFRARWPLGTRERVSVEVLATTGLRRGDAGRLGRPYPRDGVFAIRTEMTGTEVYRPHVPDVARAIGAGPVGELACIAGGNGEPMVKENFSNRFRGACNAAGVRGAAHRLRELAATLMAEHGGERGAVERRFRLANQRSKPDLHPLREPAQAGDRGGAQAHDGYGQ